ncbi:MULTISPECIES: tyrosine-type recombinase/integrase [Halomonas]|uniref:Site-specific integrase n=1 Tax=Halomonas colorata TaxID=2742615 RepID=A0ABR9G1U3_9GAMM|nr:MULTISPECIES: site-specific integrase [Halomonas]MBE0464863.1 site-specific integrase [Halomonas colorata]
MPIEIISYQLKNFEFRTPVTGIDANGEVQVGYADEKPHLISDITLLYSLQMDDSGNVVEAKGVEVANNYLMHLMVNKDHKCVSLQSRALIHFFAFLSEHQMRWDVMPHRQNKRPTYRFKKHLEALYRSREAESKLEASTCQGYMRCVVNFYRHMIAKGHPFDNPPFEHEVMVVNVQGGYSSMSATRSINVQTTDLRIKAANRGRRDGIPPKLVSLSKFEWDELDFVLRKDRRIIRNINGREVVGSLAIEFSFIFLIMRYSGLRRGEIITFRASSVFRPTADQIKKGYVTLRIGPSCGVQTKNGTEREIEMPAYLMLKLYEYTMGKRYIRRRNMFEKENSGVDAPFCLNNKGNQFSSGTLNARWGEVRKMMTKRIGRHFEHKPHNLRATYGVFRLYSLIDAGVPQSDALTLIQRKMGHSDISSTLHYLKQVQEEASGDEKAEHVYEYLFDREEFEF